MKSFIKRLWRRGWFLGCTWVAIALFTALLLVRQYVDWTGKRRWAAVQEMLAREGESLDFHKIAPEAVPDDQNFCAILPLKDLALAPGNNDDTSELGLKRLRIANALPNGKKGLLLGTNDYLPIPKLSHGAELGKATDMTAWAKWLRINESEPAPPDSHNRARNVLAELAGNDGLVGELALGLNRPEAQWTPAWKTRVLPELLSSISFPYYYSAIQSLSAMLCLRSTAAARAGEPVKAHEVLLIDVRMNQAFLKEPFFISNLITLGISVGICNTIWELCDAHSGTAEDFDRLQQALSRMDFRESFLYAERSEMALAANSMECLKRTRDMDIFLPHGLHWSGVGNGVMSCGLHLISDGCFDLIAAPLVKSRFDYAIKPLRDAGFNGLLAKQKEMAALITEHKSHLYRHLDEIAALVALPTGLSVCYKVVYTQSIVNEAVAACALERYRIEYNTYPDTLEAANRAGEKSIPLDAISGKPMGYRKTPDGRYALWCVGFDGKDDGGKRVLDGKNPEKTRFSSPDYFGDWVWDFPTK